MIQGKDKYFYNWKEEKEYRQKQKNHSLHSANIIQHMCDNEVIVLLENLITEEKGNNRDEQESDAKSKHPEETIMFHTKPCVKEHTTQVSWK